MTNKANKGYFQNLKVGITTSIKGLALSIRHFKNARKSVKAINVKDSNYFTQNQGIVTLQYPTESISVPEIGRYRLFNEMDDCIVCDKCAKICPVDCIDIEPIKATEQVGTTSDGSPIRLYAAKFDIDMAKCCFCGLCTTVCPTECLTMTNTFDFSEFEVKDFNYHYANISPAVAQEKRDLYEQFVLEKAALKNEKETLPSEGPAKEGQKPAFRPTFKPSAKATEQQEEDKKEVFDIKKPVFKPVFKPSITPVQKIDEQQVDDVKKGMPKPVFKPSFKPATKVENEPHTDDNKEEVKPKSAFRPTFKPVIKPKDNLPENE